MDSWEDCDRRDKALSDHIKRHFDSNYHLDYKTEVTGDIETVCLHHLRLRLEGKVSKYKKMGLKPGMVILIVKPADCGFCDVDTLGIYEKESD